MTTEKKKKVIKKRKPATAARSKVKKELVEPAPPAAAAAVEETLVQAKPARRESFFTAVGRRKRAIARVRYYPAREKGVRINGKELNSYFPILKHQKAVAMPVEVTQYATNGQIDAKVIGGGVSSQVIAVQLGIARILVQIDQAFKPVLRASSLLTRDSRVKERKKYGLKGARRAPQWQKR